MHDIYLNEIKLKAPQVLCDYIPNKKGVLRELGIAFHKLLILSYLLE